MCFSELSFTITISVIGLDDIIMYDSQGNGSDTPFPSSNIEIKKKRSK